MPFGPPPGGDDEGPGGPPKPDGDDEGGMFGPMEMPDPTPIAKGPFYALKVKLFHENAVGGMVTDSQVRVLKNGQPIPGLYAAGDNIRGIMLPGEIGVQYIESFLSALTVAFSSGYLAGEEAVKYLG
jgi:predicted oxidoreductase